MPNWAVVVGINRYPPAASQRPLNGAVADACDFAEWALDPAGGDVPPQNLYLWTYPWPRRIAGLLAGYLLGQLPHWYNRRSGESPPNLRRPPDAMEIVYTAQKLGEDWYQSQKGRPAGQIGRIYVFFAGHGLRAKEVRDTSIQTCFIAGDFQPSVSNTADGLVPCVSLRSALRNKRFEEVVMFLDCCRTETPFVSLEARPICDLTKDRQPPGWSIGHATHDEGYAYETEGRPVRGAYSKTLVAGLRGYRNPMTQALSVKDLESYVSDNIGTNTKQNQRPYFDYLPKDQPLDIVRGLPVVANALPPGPYIHLGALQPGESVVVIDGNNRPVPGCGPFGAQARSIQLPSLPDGLYALQVVGQPHREVLFRQPKDREIHAP